MSRVSASSSTRRTAGIHTSAQGARTKQGSARSSSKHFERLRAASRVAGARRLHRTNGRANSRTMEPATRVDGRVERGERTRRQILDAAVDIASVEGLEGL